MMRDGASDWIRFLGDCSMMERVFSALVEFGLGGIATRSFRDVWCGYGFLSAQLLRSHANVDASRSQFCAFRVPEKPEELNK